MSDPLAGLADEPCPDDHPRAAVLLLATGHAAVRVAGYWAGAALGGLTLGAAAAIGLSADNLRRIRRAEQRLAATLTTGARA